jgi:hypothetical protein
VNGDVIGLIALNEILGLFFGGVVRVALEVHAGNCFLRAVTWSSEKFFVPILYREPAF